ncbi:MAG: DNA-3-methyladenine glycosylase [Alphaproteobacteria bacterium BRH_c36]|nr:MAG: DNA-3-methyladenine glycosylase [Alphaproteobacteria bacterium BRH_c36]
MIAARQKPPPVRCPWPGIEADIYAAYHDTEWGVPKLDDRALFEKLVLEGFQAGLSWLTILHKRENFRSGFAGFDPEKLARFTENDIARLMADTGVVRNRAKIEAAVLNAKAFLEVSEKESFAHLLWGFLENGPINNRCDTSADVPAETLLSKKMSKALKARGFRFVGPTTLYAFMQSVGMVNDHLVSCHRHEPCAKLQQRVKLPA